MAQIAFLNWQIWQNTFDAIDSSKANIGSFHVEIYTIRLFLP